MKPPYDSCDSVTNSDPIQTDNDIETKPDVISPAKTINSPLEKKVLSHPTMGGVILRLGTLPEP